MTKKFDIPLYGGRLVVIQRKDLSGVAEKYDLQITPDMDGFVFGTPDKNGRALHIVVFRGVTDPSIIAHESLHIVTQIFRQAYAHLSMDNEEPQCYLLEWVVDKIHSVVKTK